MTAIDIDPNINVVDGTVYRNAIVRIRENGLKTLLGALADGKTGFSKAWTPRFELVDNKLMIIVPSNTGKLGEYEYLSLDVFLTLTPDELKFVEKETPNAQTA